jgi:small subunit ribosomal protein S7
MSRKKRVRKQRRVQADSRYNSIKLAKFINRVMLNGKKRLAERIVYDALDELAKGVKDNPLDAFDKAVSNVVPLMEVKSRRVGGSTYQIPMEVRPERGLTLAMRWLVNNSRSKSGKAMTACLSSELVDAYNTSGLSVKKKEDTHKMAESNKAFAHFRW